MSDTVQDQPEALNMVRAAAAELVGTLVLVLVGTAVAVAAILGRQIAGSPYDSLRSRWRSDWCWWHWWGLWAIPVGVT